MPSSSCNSYAHLVRGGGTASQSLSAITDWGRSHLPSQARILTTGTARSPGRARLFTRRAGSRPGEARITTRPSSTSASGSRIFTRSQAACSGEGVLFRVEALRLGSFSFLESCRQASFGLAQFGRHFYPGLGLSPWGWFSSLASSAQLYARFLLVRRSDSAIAPPLALSPLPSRANLCQPRGAGIPGQAALVRPCQGSLPSHSCIYPLGPLVTISPGLVVLLRYREVRHG